MQKISSSKQTLLEAKCVFDRFAKYLSTIDVQDRTVYCKAMHRDIVNDFSECLKTCVSIFKCNEWLLSMLKELLSSLLTHCMIRCFVTMHTWTLTSLQFTPTQYKKITTKLNVHFHNDYCVYKINKIFKTICKSIQ